MQKIIQPAGWARPKGYANGVLASGRLLFVGGQVGWNSQEKFESDDLVDQCRQALSNVVDDWYPATLAGPRGRTGAELAAILRAAGVEPTAAGSNILDTCRAARAAANPGDRIIALGSFHTVAPVLAARPWFFDIPPPHSREA